MLLLLSNTYTRTKFSRVTMNSQNQETPLNASTTVPHCCQQLFLSISSYTKKKNSSQKVCNRYILSFQTKVGNRSIYDNKVSCFISSFYCFCCVPILYWKSWSFLLVVEHQQCHVPPISPFYQRKLYFGMLGHSVELFLGQIFHCLKGEWCLHPFEQQLFSFTQHQVPSISTV